MKKKVILVLIIILSVNNSIYIKAQDKFIPETTIGIKLGANFSKIIFDTLISQSLLQGFNGGVVFEFISEPHLGIQLELNYSQKGWSENLDSSNIYRRKLNYLEFPFMTRIEIGNGNTKFTINLGAYFSYLIYETQTMKIINKNEIRNYYNNKIDNNFEYGLCFGLGLMRKTSIGNFELEFRFNQGLSNIFDSNRYSISTSQNQVISVSLFYLIKL